MRDWTQKAKFRHGFLYALGELRERVSYQDTPKLHAAFNGMFQLAAKTMPTPEFEFLSGMSMDPMFGVFHETDELILEGEQDLLLEWGRNTFYFQACGKEATQELERVAHADWFRSLAKYFLEELSRSVPVVV